jgi:hypothetical protein
VEVLITHITWDLEGQPELEVPLPRAALMFEVPTMLGFTDSEIREGITQSLANAFGFQLNDYRLSNFDALAEMDADEPYYFPRDLALCLYHNPTDGVGIPKRPTTYVVLGTRNSGNTTPNAAVDKITELMSRNAELVERLAAARRDLWRFRVVASDARGALLAANGLALYPHMRNWTQEAADQLAGIIEDTAAAVENE